MAARALFPTAQELTEAPAFHFQAFFAKKGKEKELLESLIAATEAVRKADSKAYVTIFQVVHGDGPTYLLVVKARNPAALHRLSVHEDLKALGTRANVLAARAREGSISEAAVGKLGR